MSSGPGMQSSPAGELSALALELYRVCREAPVDRYQNWALARLREVVDFDAGKWVSGHMTKQAPVVHSVTLFNRPPAMLVDYERVKQHDFVAFDCVANRGRALVFNAIASSASASPQLAAYLRKWRTAHALCCVTIDPFTELATGIGVWREAPERPFTEEERAFFEAAMPHLIETYAMARIAHLLRAAQPKNAARYASAIADGLARLQVAPADFLSLMRREWPDWRGHRLPPELEHVVRGGLESRYVGRGAFFRAIPFEDVVLVQARGKQAADELTVRELEIARLAAEGLSYGEVAGRLAISPATVRSHLSSVYGKLKVRKQAEMVSVLGEAE